MRFLFPPGDISWKNDRPQSAWREFNFVFNQIKRAIEPYLSFGDMFISWNDISKLLSERPRKRKSQLLQYYYYE
jgi:hypothetical protein